MTDNSVKYGEVSDPTSSSLLDRVKAQNQAEWERLVTLYTPLVYHWCRQAGLQPADAADVGQEVFRAVARKVAEFRHDRENDTFRGWLRMITRNKLRDHARSAAAELPAVGGSTAHEWLKQVPAEAEQSDSAEAGHDDSLVFRQALELIRAQFEERTWLAFWRVTVDDLSPEEVARELQTTVNAVYLAKSRVLRRLREEFAGLIAI